MTVNAKGTSIINLNKFNRYNKNNGHFLEYKKWVKRYQIYFIGSQRTGHILQWFAFAFSQHCIRVRGLL